MNKQLLLVFTALTIFRPAAHAIQSDANIAQLPDDRTKEAIIAPSDKDLNATNRVTRLGFRSPNLAPSELVELHAKYSYVDPLSIVPQKLRDDALAYYHANQGRFRNKSFISIVDFSLNSSQARLFIVDMSTGAVWAIHVAHGKGSDPNNDGTAEKFSNTAGSEMSSLGFYATAETYQGKHGLSLRVDGLSATNSNVRSRAVVIHGANYVSDANLRPGRSWGCFAIPMNDRDKVIGLLKTGSLLYAGLSK